MLTLFWLLQPENVNGEMFLTAALENKPSLVEKYLADGGNPDISDHVRIDSIMCLFYSKYEHNQQLKPVSI